MWRVIGLREENSLESVDPFKQWHGRGNGPSFGPARGETRLGALRLRPLIEELSHACTPAVTNMRPARRLGNGYFPRSLPPKLNSAYGHSERPAALRPLRPSDLASLLLRADM